MKQGLIFNKYFGIGREAWISSHHKFGRDFRGYVVQLLQRCRTPKLSQTDAERVKEIPQLPKKLLPLT